MLRLPVTVTMQRMMMNATRRKRVGAPPRATASTRATPAQPEGVQQQQKNGQRARNKADLVQGEEGAPSSLACSLEPRA